MKRESLLPLLPTLFFLWGAVVVSSALCTEPLHRATPLAPDEDVFEPGGMLFIETIFLHGSQLKTAALQSLALFLISTLLLTVIRSRLTAVIVDTQQGFPPRKALFARTPAYLGASLLYGILIASGSALLFWIVRVLPPLEGKLPPERVVYYVAVLLVAYLLWLSLATLVDLFRLSLFHGATFRGRLNWAFRTGVKRSTSLLCGRAARGLLTLASGWVVLHVSARPIGAPFGPVVTFMASQAAVGALLIVEVWWLLFAHDQLLRMKEPPFENNEYAE